MHKFIIYTLLLLPLVLSGCKKDWLEAKNDLTLSVPSTVSDLQKLLDNNTVFNVNSPAFGELGVDDHYLLATYWQGRFIVEKNAYVWAKDFYEGTPSTYYTDWTNPYSQVYYANTVLEGSAKLSNQSMPEIQNLTGSALFYRSFAFYDVATLFAKPYKASTATNEPGIPLRLNSNFNDASVRATNKQTYDQITGDLKIAAGLLPVTPLYKTRPSRAAAYALLARVYLSMELYDSSLKYADSCLITRSALLNYNNIKNSTTPPFQLFNDEVIYHNTLGAYASLRSANGLVDSLLYQSYNSNDLRKTLYFNVGATAVNFKGSYNPSTSILFNGLATDEIYLAKAESQARTGKITEAMLTLNTLLGQRWKTGTFNNFTAATETEALTIILAERRKELLFRNIRWSDLRRLNNDDRFKKTLKRVLGTDVYELAPGDNRYTMPIPPDVIQLSGMQQNQR